MSITVLQYDTITCEGNAVQKIHKIRENTLTYFHTNFFPYSAVVSGDTSLICNEVFQTDIGMRLGMMLYNGESKMLIVDDGIQHASAFSSNKHSLAFFSTHHNISLKAYHLSEWTAFEDTSLCPNKKKNIPVEEGRIIPFMTLPYCMGVFTLKFSGKYLKYVRSRVATKSDDDQSWALAVAV